MMRDRRSHKHGLQKKKKRCPAPHRIFGIEFYLGRFVLAGTDTEKQRLLAKK
jgi:hypothetical protein